jgi:hypothetical protein
VENSRTGWLGAALCAAVVYAQVGVVRAADGVTVYQGGAKVSVVDEAGAKADGLTVVNLGASFAPPILNDAPELGDAGKQPYADIYRALADERFDVVPEWSRADDERFLEVYGIFPSPRILRARLTDDARHACHAAIDQTPLATYPNKLWELPKLPVGVKPGAKALAKRAAHEAAVRVVQGRLRCDGLLDKRAKDGVFDIWTADGVRMFQRKHMIISWGVVDDPTRAAFLTDSRELDFRSLLRALRERVVAATGIIEDGTAGATAGTILGRTIDPMELGAMHAYGALPNAAPDLVSNATEVAAKALGWTGPVEAAAWFRSHGNDDLEKLLVALPLPAPPAYHSAHMELRAVIDRGEVYYGYPYDESGKPIPQLVSRRPTVTLYAKNGDKEVALVRWNSTIGGWQPEVLEDGTTGLKYKSSDVGKRVWREVVATQAWLPPDTTPDSDLIKKGPGKKRINREIVGPGFASAYGLAMMVNEIEWKPHVGEPSYVDKGVRVHGSVSYRSMLKGYSHGCHRLFNHLAIRMASFLIAHRNHVTEGRLPVMWSRAVKMDDKTYSIQLDNRGFGYELTPPVPVEVLEGTIKGDPKWPILEGMPAPAKPSVAATVEPPVVATAPGQ